MNPTAFVDDPIQWHEGMLLAPQHFQQNDLYWQRQLRHLMEQVEPYYWGLLELKYDVARLGDGLLQIDAIRAVLPDGLVVMSGLGEAPGVPTPSRLTLDLKADPTLAAGRPVRVHLIVPACGDGSASDRASNRRYDAVEGLSSVDDNTGTDPIPVHRLRSRVRLFAAAEPSGRRVATTGAEEATAHARQSSGTTPGDGLPANVVAMPIMVINKTVSGRFATTSFHPPMLELGASAFLGDAALQTRLEKLVQRIRLKGEELLAQKGNRSQNVFALTAALPQLEVLVHSRRAHPFDVYQKLASLVGSTSALDPDRMPPIMKPYRHEDTEDDFAVAIHHVEDLLNRPDLEYGLHAFERIEPDTFKCCLDPTWKTDELVVEVSGTADRGWDAGPINAWMDEAYIGGAAELDARSHLRSPGAWRERLTPAEAARYTHRADVHFFAIRPHTLPDSKPGTFVIARDQPLVIRGSGRGRCPERIVLYRPHGRAGGRTPGK